MTLRLATRAALIAGTLAGCASETAGPELIDRFDVLGTWNLTLDTYTDCPTPAKLKYTLAITDKDLTDTSYGVDVNGQWDFGPLVGWVDLPRGDVVLHMQDPSGSNRAVIRAQIEFDLDLWFGDVIDAAGLLVGSSCRYHLTATRG